MLTVFAMFGWFCMGVTIRHLVRRPLVQKYVKGDKVWVIEKGGMLNGGDEAKPRMILDVSAGKYIVSAAGYGIQWACSFREAERRLALRDDSPE